MNDAVIQVKENKRAYLPLLLIGDEQENMIERYLMCGELFRYEMDGKTCAVCVVTHKGEGVYELNNIAVLPEERHAGIGRRLIEFVFSHYSNLSVLYVGTGESPGTLGFYQACGFEYSHRVPGFFRDYYDHEIVEDGVILTDMVYLKRERGDCT